MHIGWLFNGIGLVGVFSCLLAYALQQIGRINGDQLSYLWLNITGSVGILISLYHAWNLPAALMEVAWALFSIVGIVRYYKRHHEKSI
jgi:hypothetical protein